jgi:hypothetical protein
VDAMQIVTGRALDFDIMKGVLVQECKEVEGSAHYGDPSFSRQESVRLR